MDEQTDRVRTALAGRYGIEREIGRGAMGVVYRGRQVALNRLAAVKATSAALTGDPFGELPAWLELLAGFDVVMLIAGAGTYGFLLEE